MSVGPEFFEGIPWHQRWEIEPGVFTPGANPVDVLMDQAGVPKDLSGLSVLDIGAWNGCFTFECERRGAARVLAIGPESSANTGFDKIAAHLSSKATYQQGTIYHLDPSMLGTFDVVICFGVLYHLRHPMLALDMVRRVCKQALYLETAGIDDNLVLATEPESENVSALRNHTTNVSRTFDHVPLSAISPVLSKLCISQFYRGEELNKDSTNWFAFNRRCLEEMLKSSGFWPTLVNTFGHRIAVACEVTAGYPEWMTNSGEGIYYDVISKPIMGNQSDLLR